MTQSHHMVDIHNDDFISIIADKSGIKEDLLDRFRLSEAEFAEDWGISCHKSHFQGLECLYVRHSGIEHIYVREDMYSSILRGDEAEERRKAIEELDEHLDEYDEWQEAKETKQQYQALARFVHENKKEFESNHILLASLFAYGNPYVDIVKAIDKSILLDYDNTSEATLSL